MTKTLTKSTECKGCSLLECPGPVNGEFTYAKIDVLFVGESLGREEVRQEKPFVGPSGNLLRTSIQHCNIQRFGITNIWRCRPPRNELIDNIPGKFCSDAIYNDIVKYNPKLVVALGSTALSEFLGTPSSVMQTQGRVFKVTWRGKRLKVLSMYHPAFLLRSTSREGGKVWWRDWEISFDKICRIVNGTYNPIIPKRQTVYHATTHYEALQCIRWLRQSRPKRLSCDIETTGFYVREGDKLLSIGFAWSGVESVSIPWRVIDDMLFYEMNMLFDDRSITFEWFNGLFDVDFLWCCGLKNVRLDNEVMWHSHLYDERLNTHSLKGDCHRYLDAPDWEHDAKKYVPKKSDSFSLIPEDRLLTYGGHDVMNTYCLESYLEDTLEASVNSYKDYIINPAARMLLRAKNFGMRVDIRRIKSLRDTFVPVLEELTNTLVKLSGDPFFNPNSAPQKLQVLKRKGMNVPNTARATLTHFEGNEFVDALLAYSEAHKIYSTYVTGIIDDIYSDLRVHPDWREPAETGRLRCSNPNMLGIPRKADANEHKWKRLVKEIFIADKDSLLLHIDRKQSEVRCACFLSGDENLKAAMQSGDDPHGNMAAQMYGPEYTKEERVWAKMVIFGIIYNREAPSLARQLGVSKQKAQKVIDDFFAKAPKLLTWKKAVMAEVLQSQELVSYFGRRRRFGLITRANKRGILNEAVNFPISSMSSDINLLSCFNTMELFGKYGVEILVPIHDAGLMSIPKDSKYLPDEIMGAWEKFTYDLLDTDIPFSCDMDVGERWSDL